MRTRKCCLLKATATALLCYSSCWVCIWVHPEVHKHCKQTTTVMVVLFFCLFISKKFSFCSLNQKLQYYCIFHPAVMGYFDALCRFNFLSSRLFKSVSWRVLGKLLHFRVFEWFVYVREKINHARSFTEWFWRKNAKINLERKSYFMYNYKSRKVPHPDPFCESLRVAVDLWWLVVVSCCRNKLIEWFSLAVASSHAFIICDQRKKLVSGSIR